MQGNFGAGDTKGLTTVSVTSILVIIGIIVVISYVSGLFKGSETLTKGTGVYTCNLGNQITYNRDSLCTSKSNISQVNHMVQFEDGSWCDFINGRCENHGPGDLILNSVLYKGK